MSSPKPRKPGNAADLRAQAAERARLIAALGWAPEAPDAAERYCATTGELAQLVRAAREERARAVGVQVVTLDGDTLEKNTAANMAKLCALRGVQAEIVWDGAQYLANGEACGRSIHGVYAWLDRQPVVEAQATVRELRAAGWTVTVIPEPLDRRIATALGWPLSDVRALSLASLRELVRPISEELAEEITAVMRTGKMVRS